MDNNTLELKKKVESLETRLLVLEKKERKRETKKLLKIISKIIILVLIAILIYRGYVYVNEKYITPYKETIDKLEEVMNTVKSNDIKDWFEKTFKK